MRIKLLLISIMILPLVAVAQDAHNTDIVFYNQGKMFVGVTPSLAAMEGVSDSAYTTTDIRLFVEGSITAADGSAIKQRGGTALTGDFIVADSNAIFTDNLLDGITTTDYKTSTGANLFQNNAIYFVNSDMSATNYVNIYTANGGSTPVQYADSMSVTQFIRRASTTTPNKTVNVVNFPNIVVGDPTAATTTKSFLVVENDIAMSVPYVVVEPGSMFSVQTRPTVTGSQSTRSPLMTTHVEWTNKGIPFDDEVIAQVAKFAGETVKGGYGVARKIDTSDASPANWVWSYAQHDLMFYDPEHPENNYMSGPGEDGETRTLFYLYPIAPLMNNLRADHLFFNTLYYPATAGNVTKLNAPIVDPTSIVDKTTYMALNIGDFDYENIEAKDYNVLNGNRAIGQYQFSRKFLQARTNFDLFKSELLSSEATAATLATSKNPYVTEVLNSKGKDEFYSFPMDNISKPISELGRYRIIGNPSLLPLDLSEITAVEDGTSVVAGTTTNTLSDMTMSVEGSSSSAVPVLVSGVNKASHLRNRYWIPNNSVIYAEKNPGQQPEGGPQTPTVYYYNISYFEAAGTGSTASLTGDDQMLAPMQLAIVEVGNLAKNYNQIDLGGEMFKEANTSILKAAPLNIRKDELLLQIINNDNGHEDRAVVVLRENGSLKSGAPYDAVKQTTYLNKKDSVEVTEAEKIEAQAMTLGNIYTKSSDGLQMATNVIPATTVQMPVYVVPPVSKTTEFTITPYRLSTMQTVSEVWLEDRFTNVFTQLTEDTKYTFSADPLTGDEADQNRFVLHFGKPSKDEDISGDKDSDLTCSYANSTLQIRGLNAKDIGSDVYVYDMQGRLMGKTKIANVPIETYSKSLSVGAYIVKISGSRNYTTKIMSTQN